MQCPQCRQDQRAGANFCDACGTPLEPVMVGHARTPSFGEVHKALSEALEQQTATSEILQVISRSRTDIQQVFETIVRNAVRLCDGFFGIAFRYDGHELSIVAHHEFSPRAIEVIARSYPAAPGPEAMAGRAILLRDGEPIGVINVTRVEPRAFTGIAPEDQAAVFEEFRQVGAAEKKAEGTGLGLTLCRKFIDLHGGRIWVPSQLGAGSALTFAIPARRDG